MNVASLNRLRPDAIPSRHPCASSKRLAARTLALCWRLRYLEPWGLSSRAARRPASAHPRLQHAAVHSSYSTGVHARLLQVLRATCHTLCGWPPWSILSLKELLLRQASCSHAQHLDPRTRAVLSLLLQSSAAEHRLRTTAMGQRAQQNGTPSLGA